MGKVVKIAVGIALIGAVVFAGPLGIAAALKGGGLLGLGVLTKGTLLAVGASLALGTVAEALVVGNTRIPGTIRDRLSVSFDPTTPRKMVFGTTAMNTDLVFMEPDTSNQDFVHYVIVVAAHKVTSINQIFFENNLAWSSALGVTGNYNGYLEVITFLVGGPGVFVGISPRWGKDQRMTGCAYVYMRIRRSGLTSSEQSPLVGGLPSRVTVVGEGAQLYDPRLDSDVSGGVGPHNPLDQTTWGIPGLSTSPDVTSDPFDNPALQLLWFLLGWKINNKLSVGCGIPPDRIDLESFAALANHCDEEVPLANGSTQRRYRTSGVAGEGDGRLDVINTFLSSMNATLRDNTGKLSVSALKDETDNPVLDFDADDVLGGFNWTMTGGLAAKRNKVRGRFVDPTALYQPSEYPLVESPSSDGIERVLTLELPFVENATRAQRIAKQVLVRNQFRGRFSAEFSPKALGVEVGDVVTLTLPQLTFVNKLFRVVSRQVNLSGRVPLELVEEDASIYAWDATTDQSIITPNLNVTAFNPANNLAAYGGQTANWSGIVDDNGNRPQDKADVTKGSQVTLLQPQPFCIQADSFGVTTTNLSAETRSIAVYKGGVRQTEGVTVGTSTSPSSNSIGIASVVESDGFVTVTLSRADAAGSVTIEVEFEGVTYNAIFPVNRTRAPMPVEGGSGALVANDSDWLSLTSGSETTITKILQVRSNGSGELAWRYGGTYNPSNVTFKAEYSTSSSGPYTTFTDGVLTGSLGLILPGEEEPSFVSPGDEKTQTGLTANTDYFVRLRATRNAGTGTISFSDVSFTVRQP